MPLFFYMLRRLTLSLLLIVVASFVVFAGVRATIDPTQSLAASKDPNARVEMRQKLGLDRPITEQYRDWISGVVKGELGVGDKDGEEVTTKLKRGFQGTLELLIWGVLVAGCLGITFGIIAAIKRNQFLDYALSGFSYFGIAVPVFALAYVLIYLFSYYVPIKWLGQSGPWFSVSGNPPYPFGQDASGAYSLSGLLQYFKFMTLPIVVISFQLIASWSRYQRSAMVEALQSDYIRTAYAKGLSKYRVYFKHAFRNSQIPMVTVIALDIGLLFQGLIFTEIIFGMSGMGRIFTRAIDVGDATTIAGWTLVTATIVIVANLIADLMLPLIDPRVRTR